MENFKKVVSLILSIVLLVSVLLYLIVPTKQDLAFGLSLCAGFMAILVLLLTIKKNNNKQEEL